MCGSVCMCVSLLVDLSHFVLCRVLGRGGFGKVNAVQRRSDDQFFAMKAISKHKLLKKEYSVYMTWLERKVMSSFHSDFLVSCVYAFQDENVNSSSTHTDSTPHQRTHSFI